MSSTVWWILAGSIPVALIIMLVAWLVMRSKIKSIKEENSEIKNVTGGLENPALNRKDHGKLLWDLRDKTNNPLSDTTMEYAINTILRNKFQRLLIVGFIEKYEEASLIKLTNIKKSSATFDFALVNMKDELVEKIDDIMKRAEPKSIIMIVNAPKDKHVKKLLTYLKYTGVRNEYNKIDEGVILIAK